MNKQGNTQVTENQGNNNKNKQQIDNRDNNASIKIQRLMG